MAPDPAQPDIVWHGYSGWAMLPSFVVCGVLSLFLLMGGWFFDDARSLADQFGSLAFFALTWAIWIVQLFRWIYRGSTYVYRLTARALYLDLGFLYPPERPIELKMVTKVEWGSNVLGRFFGVGWVAVCENDREVVTFTGIVRPAAFAEQIEAAVHLARVIGLSVAIAR